MGALNELRDRLTGLVAKLEAAKGKASGASSAIDAAIIKEREAEHRRAGAIGAWSAMSPEQQAAQGLRNRYGNAGASEPSSRALDAAVKAETRARNAATKMLEAEAAEKRALLPQLRAEAKLMAFQSRTDEQQARAYQSAKRLGIGQKTASGGDGMFGSVLQGLGVPAAFTGAAGGAAVGFAIDRAVNSLSAFAASAINATKNAQLTRGQRAAEVIESVPFVATGFRGARGLTNAMSGATQEFRALTLDHAMDVDRFRLEDETAQRVRDATNRMVRAGLRREALGALPYAPLQFFDRGTLGGAQGQSDYDRRRPLLDENTRMMRAAREARGYSGLMEAHVFGAHSELQTRIRLRDQAHAENERVRNIPGLQDPDVLGGAAYRLSLANQRVEQARDVHDRAVGDARSANENAIQRETLVRQSMIGVLESELHIQQERERRIRGNTGRFGSMNRTERMNFDAASEFYQSVGGNLDMIPGEARDAIMRGAPDWMRQQQERFGETTPEYQRATQRGQFGTDTQSLADIRQQLDATRVTANLVMNLDANAVADRLFEVARAHFADWIRNVNARMDDVDMRHRIEQQIRNNQNN